MNFAPKFRFLVGIASLGACFVFAQPAKGQTLEQKLLDVFYYLKSMNSARHICPPDQDIPIPESSFQSVPPEYYTCVESICGQLSSDPDPARTEKITALVTPKKNKKYDTTEIEEVLQKFALSVVELQNQVAQDIKEIPHLPDYAPKALWPSINIQLALELSQYAWDYETSIRSSEDRIHLGQLDQARREFPVRNIKSNMADPPGYFLNKNPGKSLDQSIDLEKRRILEGYKKIYNSQKTHVHIKAAIAPKIRRLERSLAAGSFTLRDPESAIQAVHEFALTREMIESSAIFQKPPGLNITFNDWTERVNKFSEGAKSHFPLNPKALRSFTKNNVQRCIGAIVERTKKLPLDIQEIREMEAQLENAKRSLSAGFLTLLSEHSRKSLQEKMSTIKLAPTQFAPEYTMLFLKQLKSYTQDLEDELKYIKTRPRSEQRDIRLSQIYSPSTTQDLMRFQATYIEKICTPARDQSPKSIAKNKAIVMDYSEAANMRIGVLKHELAHQLFDSDLIFHAKRSDAQLSSQSAIQLNKIRNCLNAQHGGYSKNQHWFEIEDLADAASAFNSVGQPNLGCRMMETRLPSENSSVTLGDNHSSNIFRLLNAENIKHGAFTKSCRDLVPRLQGNLEFKKCL